MHRNINVTTEQVLDRSIFNTAFNLGFGHPKSDTCHVCDNNSGADIEEHKSRASLAFDATRRDRQHAEISENVTYITFDMEKTLPLPKLSTNIAFYLRQIWLYNVGIHVIRKGENRAYFNIWSEDQAGRKAEEVGSAILSFLDAAEINGGHLIAWSDSCAGQLTC